VRGDRQQQRPEQRQHETRATECEQPAGRKPRFGGLHRGGQSGDGSDRHGRGQPGDRRVVGQHGQQDGAGQRLERDMVALRAAAGQLSRRKGLADVAPAQPTCRHRHERREKREMGGQRAARPPGQQTREGEQQAGGHGVDPDAGPPGRNAGQHCGCPKRQHHNEVRQRPGHGDDHCPAPAPGA
jgi:hypothetical protein